MLAVGCRFTEVMTDWRRMTVPANLIQIDLDPTQIGMNFPVRLGNRRRRPIGARGDLPQCCLASPPRDGWGSLWDEARSARPARPEWLIDTLRSRAAR